MAWGGHETSSAQLELIRDDLHGIVGTARHDPQLSHGPSASLYLNGESRGLEETPSQCRTADSLEGVGEDLPALIVKLLWEFGASQEGGWIGLPCSQRHKVAEPGCRYLFQHSLRHLRRQGSVCACSLHQSN
jgi:hypothetical protein